MTQVSRYHSFRNSIPVTLNPPISIKITIITHAGDRSVHLAAKDRPTSNQAGAPCRPDSCGSVLDDDDDDQMEEDGDDEDNDCDDCDDSVNCDLLLLIVLHQGLPRLGPPWCQ